MKKVIFLGENDFNYLLPYLRYWPEIFRPTAANLTGGVTTKRAYFPADNSNYFDDGKYSLVDWLRQFSKRSNRNLY